MPNNSADIFKYSHLTNEEQFKVILEGIVVAFKNMLVDCKTIENDERTIRNYLCENYLKNDNFREKHFLTPFIFEPEPAVLKDAKEVGFIDIKVITSKTFTKSNNYYTIECKKLDGNYLDKRKIHPTLKNYSYATKYIKDGLMRFVKKKYPTTLGVNGMVAFVIQSTDIDGEVLAINNLISNRFKKTNTVQLLSKVDIIPDFDYAYCSSHLDVENSNFDLYHLMLDYSGIIKQ